MSLSPERGFLERFRQTMDPALVEAELSRCLPEAGPRPCGYVGRTVFRFRPELVRDGRAARIEELLRRDAKLRIDLAIFTSASDPQWWRGVEDAVRQRR